MSNDHVDIIEQQSSPQQQDSSGKQDPTKEQTLTIQQGSMKQQDFSEQRDTLFCAVAPPRRQGKGPLSYKSAMSLSGMAPVKVSPFFSVVTKTAKLWPNEYTIRYAFLDGSPSQQNKVTTTIKEWLLYVNLYFQMSHVKEDSDVRISFDRKLGSWSYVGTDVQRIPKSQATMNLGWVKDTEDTSPDEKGVILHEWGHTLGLLHEHQNPTRGRKITLDEDRVFSYYQNSQGWPKELVQSQIIDVYNTQEISNYSEVDLKSIMIYFMPAALNKQRITIPVINELSDLDKAYMTINYPYRDKPNDPNWSLDKALEIAKIDDDDTVFTIKEAFQQAMNRVIEPAAAADSIRTDFSTYVANKQGHGRVHGLVQSRSSRARWCRKRIDLHHAIKPSSGALFGFVLTDFFWPPGSTITYGFMRGDQPDTEVTPYRKERVREALANYQKYVPLTFKHVDASKLDFDQEAHRKACQMRISFGAPVEDEEKTSANYGWAFRGTSLLTEVHDPEKEPYDGGAKWATVFLGGQPYGKDTEDYDLSEADFTLYHELGHVLGLNHEHESPFSPIANDSDTPSGTNPDDTDKHLVSTPFDPDSVMLYENLPYKNDSGRRTKRNTRPSITDYYLLSLMHPDSGDKTGKFAAALRAFQFMDVQVQHFLDRAVTALAPNPVPGSLRDLRHSIASDLNERPRLATAIESPAPQHGAQERGAPGGTEIPGFLMELVNSLKKIYNPGGNQRFTLQNPGRFLQQSEYAWDTSSAGIYGQFVKPVAVNEAEFRLVDQLYDFQDVVTGPNGTNLSIVYEQLLNNLLPKHVKNGLAERQALVRGWLLKDVPQTPWVKDIIKRQLDRENTLADAFDRSMGITRGNVGGSYAGTGDDKNESHPSFALVPGRMFGTSSQSKDKTESLSRMELGDILMNEYLFAKQDWELQRDALITQASKPEMGTPESKKALDALTRELAHITAARQAQLASKYADAVVRGHSHAVREYMGYLDIASPAEALQNAKDSLRESSMSSLNGAMKVYPVLFTPIDWFQGLSTSFKIEDLTSDPDIIRIQINAKSQQLDILNSQLVALEMGMGGDTVKLKEDVAKAQNALDNAQSKLAQSYTSNVVQMARTYVNQSGQLDIKEVSKRLGIQEDRLAGLSDQMESVRQAQNTLTAASRALSQLRAAHALAEATDTRQQQQQIRLQIQSITKDLEGLQVRLQVLTTQKGSSKTTPRADGPEPELDPKEPLGLPEELNSSGGRWQTITLTSSSKTRADMKKDQSSGSSKQWSANLWIASGGGSSSSEHGSSAKETTASEDTVDLAFRATLVTVDRGGWFQPQFFKQSKAFYKVNEDISWVDKGGAKGLMPGFPIAFLLAKDIVIRIIHTSASSKDIKQFDKESFDAAGGVLCFSYSQSDTSSSSSTNSSFQAYSNGFIVKIPGPQILGYMIQKTDEDEAVLMPATLPADFTIPEDEYNRGLGSKDPPKPNEQPGPGHGITKRTISEDTLREVMGKMLNERMEEMIDRIDEKD